MVTRKKNFIEKLLSFKQHKRRFGSRRFVCKNVDFKELKNKKIENVDFSYTHGSKTKIADHLQDLKNEFSGKSELEYYHAELNVLLRRGFQTEKTFIKLNDLWEKEWRFLCKNLNTRWLISAADSFIDHDKNQISKSYAFSAVCLVNTCKIYETERFLTDTKKVEYKEDFIAKLKKERIGLFDGTSAFTIGTCDTLRNMRWRLDSLNGDLPSLKILREIFARVNDYETAYHRLSKYHINKNTIWW